MKAKLTILLSLFLCSCHLWNDTDINSALEFAGNNRIELEKVLSHYKDEPEKLKAARFLIANMPGHMSQDSSIIAKLQTLYDAHVVISEKYNWIRTAEWKNELDSFMQTKQNMLYLSKIKQDARLIKADFLIREIDRSFQAWKENAYSKDIPFDDFCSYILPYRFSEYIYPDHARELFYERHAHYFSEVKGDFRDVCDTLLFKYVFQMHNDFAAASLPLYTASSFEYIKRGSCEDKAWFNCLLMSALGMPVTIDFVPHWGDRSGRHTWNSLLIDGETHPLEPFWDVERWKYKTIYNNETFDMLHGKFRLPKVYRQTYERHIEGPMAYKSVPKEDIPSLFRNPFMTDVSSEYFKTTDIQLDITKQIPRNARYCYLCVFNTGEWRPVQWGEIKRDRSVVFRGMGRDIVYLPMFYQNGTLTQAAPIFLLDQAGNYTSLKPREEKMSVTMRSFTSHLTSKEISACRKLLRGSSLVGFNKTEEEGDTLHTFGYHIDTYINDTVLSGIKPYRYIRLVPANDSIGLCEISFFEKGQLIRDSKAYTNSASLVAGENANMLVDHLSSTAFKCRFKNEQEKKDGILFDLGTPHLVDSITYRLYTPGYMEKNTLYEIYYWDDKWMPAGTQEGGKPFITFDNIPQGTLYRIQTKGYNDRIFMYKDGIAYWL